jgi:hypothetical protein
MLTRVKFLLVPLLLLFTLMKAYSQDVRKDVNRINRAYKEVKNLSADIVFHYFSDYKTTSYSEESFGKFNKTGSQLYFQYENKEYISTDKLVLNIDNDNKIMLISNLPSLADKPVHPENINLDSLLKHCKSVDYKNEGQLSSYSFHFGFSTIDIIKVYFDKKNYLISKLIFYYSKPAAEGTLEKPRIEIQYSNFQKRKSSEPKYKLDYYVMLKKSKYAATPRFKSYKLINMILTK